jgi:hypothetical protein
MTINEILNDREHRPFPMPSGNWLTERYALFQDSGTSISEFNIHHPEWPVHSLELKELQVKYPDFQFLFNGNPSLVHYSPGVQVLAWD